MPERPPAVAVVGAGIAGLSTASQLEALAAGRGHEIEVTVFERDGEVGGKLRTLHEEGYHLEWGPNGFLDNEPATLRLVDRLGLREDLLPSEDSARHRFLLIGGRLREVPLSPIAFLRSDVLSPGAKLRMAAEIILPPRRGLGEAGTDPEKDETVDAFGRRRLGRAFAERLLDPMVKGIFAGDSRRLSLAATFPRMVELERDYGGLFRAMIRLSRERRKNGSGPSAVGPGGTLCSFREGMGTLPKRLGDSLRGSLRTGFAVDRLVREKGAWWVCAGAEKCGPFHAIVDTSPAHRARDHLPDSDLRRLLGEIPYAPLVVVTLAFARGDVSHPLNGFGMLIPSSERRRLIGVLWSSSIFRRRAPEDKVLVRCMVGGAQDPEVVEQGDESLARLCFDELRGLYGLRSSPERNWIIRHERAIAQFEPGHVARLAAIDAARSRYPGLFLSGSSYRGVSVNHCVAEAERIASEVLGWLGLPAGKED
jgi:oxygen-dependent protoporphyrinogen oxidase